MVPRVGVGLAAVCGRARGVGLRGRLALALALAVSFRGCSGSPEAQGPTYGAAARSPAAHVYRFAIHPLHNPSKLLQAYQPLVDFVNDRVAPARLELEASRDYASFEEKYLARKPDFLLPNPWQTLQAATAGYRVLAMAGDPQDFKGLLIVRSDGGITRPVDLEGMAVSYPSPTALAACIMPQAFLHDHGVDVMHDLENRYVGSQESSIMNVYLGETAAGATWPPPWRAFQKEHPREAAELVVRWETESLVNNSVMARDDVPAALVDQVRAALIGLAETPEGRALLAGTETARFRPAVDADYDVVRSYIARFEADVRPVEAR